MSLFWSCCLLGAISLLFAIVLVQQMSTAVAQGAFNADQVQKTYDMFGSVQGASLTLVKSISGGEDWGPLYELVLRAGKLPACFFLGYVLFIWLSVANIITAVFVDNALKNAKPHTDELILERHKEDFESVRTLQTIFRSLDADNSNTLTLGELKRSFCDLRIINFFEMAGLDIKDVEMFFNVLSQVSESHEVDMDAFVDGCLKMKGYATNMDVFLLLFQSKMAAEKLMLSIGQCKLQMEQLKCKMECSKEDAQEAQ